MCTRRRSSRVYEHRLILQRCATCLFFHLGALPNACVSFLIMHMCGDKKNSTCRTLASASIYARRSARDEKKLMTHQMRPPSVLLLAVPVLERPKASGETMRRVGTRNNVLQGSRAIYSSSRGLALYFHMDPICYESTHNGNTTTRIKVRRTLLRTCVQAFSIHVFTRYSLVLLVATLFLISLSGRRCRKKYRGCRLDPRINSVPFI